MPNIESLLARMTLAEKAGALCVARVVVGEDGTLWEGTPSESPFGFTPTTELLLERSISHLTLMNAPGVRALADWRGAIDARAAGSRLGIPVSVLSDPRHGRVRNTATALSGDGFTSMPEPVGLAAMFSAELVEESAAMMARELRAAGIDVALHPMADLATEPRWARVAGTFGEDADHATLTMAAYIRGMQGPDGGVACTVKHFSGGGPQQGGEDAHFERGAHTVYPGGRFDAHLAPFAAAVDLGIARVMPGYAAPRGLDAEAVGFAFQRGLITGILRERLGFEGVIITDFNIVTGMRLPRLGIELPVRSWGLLDLSPVERVGRLFAAGIDQLGGEDDPGLIIRAVEDGLVSEQRLEESVLRFLREKERLGLFAPRVSAPGLGAIGGREHVEIAERARAASIVALAGQPLGLTKATRVYAEGIDPAVLADYATCVPSPEQAELAILRIDAPYEPAANALEGAFHGGSLAFTDEEFARICAICDLVPTAIDVFLERPAILTGLPGRVHALLGSFGVPDRALLDAVSGRVDVPGRLPFDLPRTMAAVEASREDVAFDTDNPLFRFGHGLHWRSQELA
ncbi:glycoside hydrolase family 3 protein [Arthrobacter sp. B2a2-09]|uniref:glycoside hydrolase family 3 protein n=1 Tax=Arthrobacter sp. B2a2-09 TaxID=2952822 RepID=UPI0022CD46E1|nr:glycoside hydrolase family 3 N-terminal domain-containing protein [Arthrobacter sp. B2a2-09]MCZ9881631.1 glycoside hydrolase family 3 protein [Arthrobacter sp. B2a2-09]